MLLLPGGGAAAYLPRPAPRRDRAPRCCCADQPPADAGAGSADASLGELLAACGAASAAAASARAAAAAAELAAARAQRALSSALAEPSPAPRTGAAPAADAPGVTARRRACLALRHTRAPNRVLPQRIVIVRHGESEGNVDESCYGRTPDPEIPLTANGHEQARGSGRRIRALMEADGPSACLFVYVSPYMRSKQTAVDIVAQLPGGALLGVREEPQLREQDFGNLQDLNAKAKEKALRQAYGRFFFRYSNGESGSDVYDRLTSFEDHMVRDIDGGRFPAATTLLVVTHGLALRLFLSRWLHWTVAEYELAFNPPNCEPVVLERRPVPEDQVCVGAGDDRVCMHTKDLYQLSEASLAALGVRGHPEMRVVMPAHEAWERTMAHVSSAVCDAPPVAAQAPQPQRGGVE